MSKPFRIAAIAGDGIGKEVLPEGLRVLEQAAKKWQLSLDIEVLDWAHCDYYLEHGQMMPADCLLYTSPSPRDLSTSRMPSSA